MPLGLLASWALSRGFWRVLTLLGDTPFHNASL